MVKKVKEKITIKKQKLNDNPERDKSNPFNAQKMNISPYSGVKISDLCPEINTLRLDGMNNYNLKRIIFPLPARKSWENVDVEYEYDDCGWNDYQSYDSDQVSSYSDDLNPDTYEREDPE